jgi:hypothetical protein
MRKVTARTNDRGKNVFIKLAFAYGWTGQETGSGFINRPRAILGQIHF